MMNDSEYVIYVRKSTDESSGMQTQSIPDQLKKCIDYAKNNDLKIRLKPKDFEFQTDKELWNEENDTDLASRQMYKETKDLYIIKEQESAKVPWLRKKWKRLIKLIKDGKIKGLLSYSPDRQARNMLEGGELIDCVDQWLVDLKYTNFHFENTASGKMMLGIWFVFSKQYSDKLSEDITRGKKSSVEKGKSQGRYKYGYYRDKESWYYKPHPKYFPLMKEAFQMKLYMWASDAYIADRLNSNWFLRENKKETKDINPKMLGNVWTDEFYYWIYIYGDSIVDMRDGDINPYYQPMINEHEHTILREKYEKKNKQVILRAAENKYEEIRPLYRWLLQSKEGGAFTPYLSSIDRFEKRLEKLRLTNPDASLKDIVKPHQIRFRNRDMKMEITFDLIEKEIIKLLDKIKIDEDAYQKYVEFLNNELDKVAFQNKEKYSRLTLQLNRAKGERREYAKRCLWIRKNAEEENIYQEEMRKHEKNIEFIQSELNNINTSERNTIKEFQIFVNVLQKSGKYYKKASYVQQAQISSLLFSNIFVDKKKKLTIKVNSSLEPIFSWKVSSFGDDGVRTHV